jgi:uncharacterized protein
MKQLLSKNTWWLYFPLTYLISWPVWIAGSALLPESLRVIGLITGAFGPFAAAVMLTGITGGKAALHRWLRSAFNLKIPVRWYILGGILLPFGIAGLHHLIWLALGGVSGLKLSAEWLLYFAYLVPTALLTGGNEEPGWRGFITPVLLGRFNLFVAHGIIGAGWALWHLPLYLGGIGNDEQQPFVWLMLYCIPLSMILTWLYYRANRSVIPVMLLHAGTNVVFRYFPMENTVFESVEDEFTVIKTIVYTLISLILLMATNGTLGYNKKEMPG